MTTENSSFDNLINEFSNIKVDIEIGPQCNPVGGSESIVISDKGEEDVIYQYNYDFYVKFQKEDKVHCYSYLNIGNDYLKILDKMRLKFYKDVYEKVLNTTNNLHTLNLLTEYKIRFSELLDNYFECQIVLSGGPVKLKDNKIIQYRYSDQKPIYDFDRARILHNFLIFQIETIEKILRYLELKISLFKVQTQEENILPSVTSENRKPLKRYYKWKSFELNTKLWSSDIKTADKFKESRDQIIAEKLKDFRDSLYKAGLITSIELKFVIQVFKNQNIIQPIVWKGTPSELYFLIRNLHDQKIITQFKYYWIVACNCFLAYNKKNEVCTHKFLQRCKSPTRIAQLGKLDSILKTLR